MRRSRLLSVAWSLTSVPRALGTQSCWFPNGAPAQKSSPCNSTQTESACCTKGAICLSNGVCQWNQDLVNADDRIGSMWRGSCTDRSWQSPDCPLFCYSECMPYFDDGCNYKCQMDVRWAKNDTLEPPFEDGGPQLVSSCVQHNWCCQDKDNGTSCCESESLIYLGNVSAIASIPSSTSTSAPLSAIENKTSLSPRTSSTIQSTLGPETTTSDGSTSLARPGGDAASVTSATAQPKPPSSSDVKINSTERNLVIGLGIIVGLAFVGNAFLIFRWRYRKRQNKRQEKSSSENWPAEDSRAYAVPDHPVELDQTAWEVAAGPNAPELADFRSGTER